MMDVLPEHTAYVADVPSPMVGDTPFSDKNLKSALVARLALFLLTLL